MRTEGESLFVEFKKGAERGSGYQLAKAAASFANTMGGWILIGVSDSGQLADWEPPTGSLTDIVRQRLEGQVDPLPSFSAAIVELPDGPVGVVRVYESADTPHVLSDGAIVVREPAQDSKLRKLGRYEATAVRSHYELVQLAGRGEKARDDAKGRLAVGALPLVDQALRPQQAFAMVLHPADDVPETVTAGVEIRLAPLTITDRWADWAVSKRAVARLTQLAVSLVGDSPASPMTRPHPRGFFVTVASTASTPWTPGAYMYASQTVTVVVDAAGVAGLRLAYVLRASGGNLHYHREFINERPFADLIRPVLAAVAKTLGAEEHLGRYLAEMTWDRMGALFRMDHNDEAVHPLPATLPSGGELTVDGSDDPGEVSILAQAWGAELARAAGLPIWAR